ncbi:MAG: response regulator, partial [Candidatus Latescibacteria bacterium]|nr:response regulator [Candidatus Latescibacterota bacterium]
MRKNARILVIDDEESIRDIVTQFFGQYGCSVKSAADGRIGVETVDTDDFDLIFLDLNMPNMTGMEALPHLREKNPDARVVIMTAFASYESKVEAREKGAYDYVLKPINLAKMKDVAEKALPDRRHGPEERSENGVAASNGAAEPHAQPDQPVAIEKIKLDPMK